MSKRAGGRYNTLPVVPKGETAVTNPFTPPTVGVDQNPRLTPQRPERITGLAGVHGYGHLPHQRLGHMRLSGRKGHRIGGR